MIQFSDNLSNNLNILLVNLSDNNLLWSNSEVSNLSSNLVDNLLDVDNSLSNVDNLLSEDVNLLNVLWSLSWLFLDKNMVVMNLLLDDG